MGLSSHVISSTLYIAIAIARRILRGPYQYDWLTHWLIDWRRHRPCYLQQIVVTRAKIGPLFTILTFTSSLWSNLSMWGHLSGSTRSHGNMSNYPIYLIFQSTSFSWTKLPTILSMKKRTSTPLMMEKPVSRPKVPPMAESLSTSLAFWSWILTSS